MSFKWTPIPLVRIAIVFSGGILLGIYQPEIFQVKEVVIGFALSLLLLVVTRLAFSNKYVSGALGFLCLFICGYLVVLVRTESGKPDHILYVTQPIIAYEGKIEDHLYERKNSFKTLVTISKIKTANGWQQARGKVNLYISKKTIQDNIRWGNRVLVNGSPSVVQPPANPHEFDFKRFLSFKNIYHQHFVQGDAIVWLGETDKGILFYAAEARRFFSNIIKQYVSGEQEQAIALALVIGVTDGVDNELENAYSASGAMHVLAVSGLHIGIIYGIILFFLKPLQKSKKGQWLVAVISLVLLWGYSFVTGLSPSVLRAVTMFSFIAIAKPMGIRSNIFNTLAGSAVILLLFDPYLIMSVGFQLSYLAVLGIIWIQRPLYLLWEAKTWLMDQVWQITCVSIAAQLTTFSLGLLYFHQFPTYFLFSNLFVIPISFAVLVVGIVLLVVSPIAAVAKWVGWVLWGLVKLLNEGVFLVERMPFSLVNNIYIDVFQSWLIMGIVTGLIFTFQFKNIRWTYAAFLVSVILAGTRWMHQSEILEERKLVVYNVKGVSAIEFLGQGKSQILADSNFLSDAERVRFHIRPNRLFSLVSETWETKRASTDKEANRMINYDGEQIAILCKPIQYPKGIPSRLVVVGTNAIWSVPKLLKTWPKAFFVIDSSCAEGQIRWLFKQGIDESRVHAVSRKGAFEYRF